MPIPERFGFANPPPKSDVRHDQQIRYPFPTDAKFPVAGQTSTPHVLTKNRQEFIEQLNALLGIGIPALIEHQKHHQKGNALMANAQGQSVEDAAAKAPFRAVYQ